ncbi:MAG: desulforedoxin [candidate division WOR-3 bacterium]
MPVKKKSKKTTQKKPKLVCEVCGLEVTVSKPCGCSEVSLICCGQPMSLKTSKPSSRK